MQSASARLKDPVRYQTHKPEAGTNLSDLRPEAVSRSDRIVISTIEGARFVPEDFERAEQVIDDLHELMALAREHDRRRDG